VIIRMRRVVAAGSGGLVGMVGWVVASGVGEGTLISKVGVAGGVGDVQLETRTITRRNGKRTLAVFMPSLLANISIKETGISKRKLIICLRLIRDLDLLIGFLQGVCGIRWESARVN